MGEGLEDGPPRAAMVMAMGARGELCSSGEVEGRGLEHVQEDMGVLTVEGIGPRWPERGDRRECSAFGEETEEKKLERGGSRAAQLAARRACDGGREQTGAPFIDETRRWRRGGRRWPGSASGAVRL